MNKLTNNQEVSELILVFFHCITNYYQISGLKWHHLLSQSSVGQRFRQAWLGSLVRISYGRHQNVTWPGLIPGYSGGRICIQAHSDHWDSLALCRYRTEVPASLLAVGGDYSASGGHSHSSAVSPSIFKASYGISNPSCALGLSDFPLCLPPRAF